MTKPIQQFRAWLKRKARQNQSTPPALFNDLIRYDLTKKPPLYSHDPTLDPPPYHDLSFKPGAAATLAAISVAVCAAAAAVPPAEVVPVTDAVAVAIANIAKAVVTLPVTGILTTAITINTGVNNIADTIVAELARHGPDVFKTVCLVITLGAVVDNVINVWHTVYVGSRPDWEDAFPTAFDYVGKTVLEMPASSAPAFSAVLKSTLLNVVNAVIITPAPSMMAVAESYGSYAGHIAREVAQGITATLPPST